MGGKRIIISDVVGRNVNLIIWASLVAQSVKNLPAVEETQVRSLDREDPLDKEVATHSSILVWKISWTEEPGGLQSMLKNNNYYLLTSYYKLETVLGILHIVFIIIKVFQSSSLPT